MALRTYPYRLAALLACVAAAPAAAEEFQALQDLFQSETVFPQERGETQITLSPNYSWGRDGRVAAVAFAAEYGITDSFQIGVEWDGVARNMPRGERSHSGVGDLEIAAKYSWMHIGDRGMHAAFDVALTLPTGDEDRDLGEGRYFFTPSAVVAADIRGWRGAQVFANFGAEIALGSSPEGRTSWFLNVGAFAPIGEWTPAIECNLSETEGNYVTPGIIWRVAPGFELGFGMPVGLNRRADRYRAILLLTHEFGGDEPVSGAADD